MMQSAAIPLPPARNALTPARQIVSGARCCASRRGLSLIELMLALTVTALIGLGIASMMGAVSAGIAARTDHRAVMTYNHATNARLTAYVAPSRCILGSGSNYLVLWHDDSTENGIVNVTEVRWLVLDTVTGNLTVSYVQFPDSMLMWQQDAMNAQMNTGSNWMSALTHYSGAGYVRSRILAEGIDAGSFTVSTPSALDARHALLRLSVHHEGRLEDVVQTLTISEHRRPSNP